MDKIGVTKSTIGKQDSVFNLNTYSLFIILYNNAYYCINIETLVVVVLFLIILHDLYYIICVKKST